MKLDLALAYLPNSYFALTQPMASAPQLTGPDGETVDFLVTTGSTNVPTSSNMTGLLSATNVIQFAADEEVDTPFGAEPVLYEVLHVGPKMIILKTPYGGYDRQHRPQRPETGTKGTIGDSVINLATGATLVSPSPAAPPTNAQLCVAVRSVREPRRCGAPTEPTTRPPDDAASTDSIERVLHANASASAGWGAGRAGGDLVRVDGFLLRAQRMNCFTLEH